GPFCIPKGLHRERCIKYRRHPSDTVDDYPILPSSRCLISFAAIFACRCGNPLVDKHSCIDSSTLVHVSAVIVFLDDSALSRRSMSARYLSVSAFGSKPFF